MPVDISRSRQGTVVIARFSGHLSEADVRQAITLAFATGRAEPGMDRLVVIESTAEVHEVDTVALQRIRRCVHQEETRSSANPSFRSVFVYSSPLHAPLLQLYKAIWDQLGLPGVEFFVAPTLAEAARLLGVPPPELEDIPE